MAKEKLNKDGFVPGQSLTPEEYSAAMAKARLKNPYAGSEGTRSVADIPIIQKQQEPEYLQQVAQDNMLKAGASNG